MTELLEYFAKFQNLPVDAKKALTEICSNFSIKKNEILQPFGHTCKTIYFLKSGILNS